MNPLPLQHAVRSHTSSQTSCGYGIPAHRLSQSSPESGQHRLHKENPAASIDELERLADTRMYEDKSKFYSERGNDRRRG